MAEDAFSNEVSKLRKEGYPIKQALAIAYSMKERGELTDQAWIEQDGD